MFMLSGPFEFLLGALRMAVVTSVSVSVKVSLGWLCMCLCVLRLFALVSCCTMFVYCLLNACAMSLGDVLVLLLNVIVLFWLCCGLLFCSVRIVRQYVCVLVVCEKSWSISDFHFSALCVSIVVCICLLSAGSVGSFGLSVLMLSRF